MARLLAAMALVAFLCLAIGFSATCRGGVVIDHNDTDLAALPLAAVNKAKTDLHIAYGHTSHGSQLITGMTAMNTFINGGGLGLSYPPNTFRWNDGPSAGALDLDDYFVDGDLGAPDRTTWAARTRTYLNNSSYADVNVVIWSWCGQADAAVAEINLYLSTMNQLELDYPNVSFVYMTGHVNGCATTGNLFLRNQQIRDYCAANDKILYDFADLDSWDPDGNYYGDKRVIDNCDYDSDGNGTQDRNWATDWQNTHQVGVDWFNCSPAHTQALNGNQKAYAAWALWTQIAALRDPVLGDASLDGRVDDADATILAAHWHKQGGWAEGDFNDDGQVDDRDASIMAAHWGEGVEGGAPIPEPSTLAALVSMALAARLFGDRRRRPSGL
jgi:hypothetical protein